MCKVNIDIAKIADTEVGKNTASWIYRVIGAPIENGVGLLFADALKEKRYKNIIRLQSETEKFKIQNIKKIPLSFAYKLLDKASLEENENLIKKWAELLANSMDIDFKGEIRKIYIDILDSLEPIDAKLLEFIASKKESINPSDFYPKEEEGEILISVDALKSLNLIMEDFDEESVSVEPQDWDDPTEKYVRGYDNGKYYLTGLGHSFLTAVNRNEN